MSTREFEFRDGSSDKFWKITLDGKATTVNFGRRGASGQTQTKKWASPDEARKNHDKLIAEKTKKGYVESKGKANGTAKGNGTSKTPLPNPLPAARGEGTRRIELSAAEWAIATWRKLTPPKPVTPAPFDREACEAKLRGLKFGGRDGKRPEWASVGLPEVMSREEAHYWFLAMTSKSQKDRAATLAKAKLDGRVTIADARAGFEAVAAFDISDRAEAAQVLSHLLSPGELAEWLLGGNLDGDNDYDYGDIPFLESYRRWVAPNLARADAERFRAQLRPHITVAKWPEDPWAGATSFEIAAALGMHDELRPVVESWKDNRYAKNHPTDLHQHPLMIVFGLGDPALVEKHVRRLRLSLRTPQHVAGWLAHTEWRALDVVTDSILKALNKKESEELIAAFRAVKAPEAAGPMQTLSMRARSPKGARQWLDENPGLVAGGAKAKS